MKMEEEMELMEFVNWGGTRIWWYDRWFDDKDLLSVQKRVVTDGWFALVDVRVKSDSIAAASSL